MSKTRPLRIAIVGGGPGGLTLAQGLLRQGLDVTVYEKSAVRDDYVQGFRLRIRERGIQALRQCLPAPLYDAFEATVGSSPMASVQLDEQLRPLEHTASPPPLPGDVDDAHAGKSVSRITLRQVLLSGLDEAQLRIGAEFTSYAHQPDGSVRLLFADGATAEADVLVGADGASSRVRQQLLPQARLFDTGGRRLAGKISLQQADALGLPPLFFEKQIGIRPRHGRGHGLSISAHRVDAAAQRAHGLIGADDASHAGIGGLHFNNTTSYLWWNTAFRKDELAPDEVLERASPHRLLELLEDHLRGWHPDLLSLLRHSHPSTVALLKVRSSEPPDPWATGPVTLLGDAIHAMTYSRALGGNTAIQDAGVLARELALAQRGDKPLLQALADYEREMREYGYAAVRLSLQALERSLGSVTEPVPRATWRLPAALQS